MKTIEQKADTYSKAVEKAKQEYNTTTSEDRKQWLEELFPELKESEDKKIRKDLITFLDDVWHLGKDANFDKWSKADCSDWITWLEKQGEPMEINPTEFDTRLQALIGKFGGLPKEVLVYYLSFYLNVVQNDGTYKIEPNFNFKVGQWIVATGKCVYLITKIDGCNVTLVDTNGVEYVFDASSLNDAHQWNITDAKNGDVLVASDGSIFLFAGVVDCACRYYAALATDGYIKINKEAKDGYWETSRAVNPATKEQRDKFEKAMADAGYTFDFKKKDLRKLKFRVGDEVITKNEKSLTITKIDEKGYWSDDLFICDFDSECNWNLVEQKPVWGEEDEDMIQALNTCIDAAIKNGMNYISFNSKSVLIGKVKNWLKSLKEEYTKLM